MLSGVTRTVGEESNCWAAKACDRPALTLQLPFAAHPTQLQWVFDSNLSREITISINQGVLNRQTEGTPPELVRAFRVRLMLHGVCVHEETVQNNAQRVVCMQLPGVACDCVVLDEMETHGDETLRVFGARLYE